MNKILDEMIEDLQNAHKDIQEMIEQLQRCKKELIEIKSEFGGTPLFLICLVFYCILSLFIYIVFMGNYLFFSAFADYQRSP